MGGGVPPPWARWRGCPAELVELWDPRTLASFSTSQIDAFASLVVGRCPLLSRAVRCVTHGGKRRRRRHWRDLAAAYVEEEAALARRQTVHMLRHVWANYEARAFGKDELKPVSGVGDDNWGGLGQTIIDALDTLWLAGLHEEFHRAALWVQTLTFDVDVNVNTFETTIRQLGGLLAAYALSGRPVLLEKAEELGSRLFAAFGGVRVKRQSVESRLKVAGEALSAGPLAELLVQMGVPRAAMESLLGASNTLPDEGPNKLQGLTTLGPQLPYSDVNLKTGNVANLASFVSLSEAYVPVEWKALSLFTGNCTYAAAQGEVLRLLNRTTDLASMGFAPILLRGDGAAFPSPENRLSLGSRGDSFYEYLLKDSIYCGEDGDPLTDQMWQVFRANLQGLIVQVDPLKTSALQGRSEANRSRKQPTHRKLRARRRPTRQGEAWRSDMYEAGASMTEVLEEAFSSGAPGGWYESEEDAMMPWTFLKEVTQESTVPKMDHLACFLPGTLALDVLHQHATRDRVEIHSLPVGPRTQIGLAHLLAQTCVHMYFRTATGLAPEITRFNSWGLIDDLGSMHNILRPETVESLFILWRTTKAQLYRNWGQRILAAFARRKTPYGYTSLNDVNDPQSLRDDMPSFFVAETIKYLMLLFSGDSAVDLNDVVFNTEAHPLPRVPKVLNGTQWACGGRSLRVTSTTTTTSQARRPTSGKGQPDCGVALAVAEQVHQRAQGLTFHLEALQAELCRGSQPLPGLLQQLSPQPEPDDAAAAEFGALRALCDGVPYEITAQERAREAAAVRKRKRRRREATEPEAAGQRVPPQASGAALATPPPSAAVPTPPVPPQAAADAADADKAAADGTAVPAAGPGQGNQECWVGGYSFEVCCFPVGTGNPECWDAVYTYAHCCATAEVVAPGAGA